VFHDNAAIGEIDMVGDLAGEALLVSHENTGHAALGKVFDNR